MSRIRRLAWPSILVVALLVSSCGESVKIPSIPGQIGEAGPTAITGEVGSTAATEAPQAPPTAAPTSFYYNLPPSILTFATGLYASPNRDDLITPAEIPAGETVYLMGRNATGSHVRVVWNTVVGWIPVSFTDYNGQRAQLEQLPIFEREPPACAEPITTQSSLSAEWKSDRNQRIAIVVDIFRSKFGDFPHSSLALMVNGTIIKSSRREIVEHGQFSLKDVVFTLPAKIQDGDVVSYDLETASDEPLTFIATIFGIPNDCRWDV